MLHLFGLMTIAQHDEEISAVTLASASIVESQSKRLADQEIKYTTLLGEIQKSIDGFEKFLTENGQDVIGNKRGIGAYLAELAIRHSNLLYAVAEYKNKYDSVVNTNAELMNCVADQEKEADRLREQISTFRTEAEALKNRIVELENSNARLVAAQAAEVTNKRKATSKKKAANTNVGGVTIAKPKAPKKKDSV